MQEKNNEVNYPLTIEKQLERYYISEEHTERHAVLWHAWNQNKRWITQLLQTTLCSYPTYSKHDESHAQSVLHNIEMILGEDRIAELSASDCFLLLHTVYIHDIGMCITHQDRENILKDRAFIDMVEALEGYEESSMYRAIMALQKREYKYEDEEDQVKIVEKLYMDKLEVYYALIQLIGEFRRGEHGEKAKERLYEWIKEPSDLGIGFSLAGMPQRMFLTVANCARMHTYPDFDAIMELPQEDNGYVSDYIHPRFVSVLLQLGDILDMDNNRFHPFMQMCTGYIPESSQQHFEKHMSIRRLHIRPDKISIEADCKTQEALRLIRKECDMLKSILKDAGYNWAIICPPGYKGALPTVESVKLYLDGRKIPEELVTTQFKISQQKAFSILEGANVYSGNFVFLREFLQNAVDATKIQYWNDCVSNSEYYKNKGTIDKESPCKLEKFVSTNNYPIEIEMEIQKKCPDGNIYAVTDKDIEVLDSGKNSHCIYGVKIRIKDFGTGIDKESILNISKVGNSRKKDRNIIESMPAWLRPTAEFGIGLQSAFLLVGSFSCYTHTRSGERYEITFGSGSSSRYEGYINVNPRESGEDLKDDTFGTCFEIFLPNNKKNLHRDCIEAWNGEDPFSESYERRRPIRHAAELIAQMAIYLNDLIGELLFPVHMNILKCPYIDIPIKKTRIDNIHMKLLDPAQVIGKVSSNGEEWQKIRPWLLDKKSWIFYEEYAQKDETIIREEVGNDVFLLDCKSAKLHIWSGDINTFATIGAKNLLKKESEIEGYEGEHKKSGYKIYYKGIDLQRNRGFDDNNFVEYVDIKGDLDRNLLNISRKSFTDKGEKYFSEVINPGLQKSIQNILKFLGKKGDVAIDQIKTEIENRFRALGEEYVQRKESAEFNIGLKELNSQIISAILLCFLACREEYNRITAYGIDNANVSNKFNELIDNIVLYLRGMSYNSGKEEIDQGIGKLYTKLQEKSLFYNICVYDENFQRSKGTINFAEFCESTRRFAILQMRKSAMDNWNSYLVEINNIGNDNVCSELERLIFARNSEDKRNIDKTINQWTKNLIRNTRGMESDEKDFRQQFLMNWMVRNIPTIAMLSDNTGNIRINILSSRIYPVIYMNDEFKMLILDRMVEEFEKNRAVRFSTIAWQSRDFLVCKGVPFSAYFVKRGMLADQSYYKVIVPISGQYLYNLKQGIQEIAELDYVKKIYRILKEIDIRRYLELIVYSNSSSRNRLLEEAKDIYDDIDGFLEELKAKMKGGSLIQWIYEFLMDQVESVIDNENDIIEGVIDATLIDEDGKRLAEWHRLYLEIAKVYLQINEKNGPEDEQSKEKINNILKDSYFKMLCTVVQFFRIGKWRENFHEEVQKKLFSQKYADSNKDMILTYIKNNCNDSVPMENIEICYNEFEKEILSLFEKSAYNMVEPVIENAIKIYIRPKVEENTKEENREDGQ